MSEVNQNVGTSFRKEMRKNSGLSIAAGVVVMIMGILAMGAPLIAGFSVAVVVGVILIVGAIGQLVFSYRAGKHRLATILGVLTIVIGAYMVANPGIALASLTIFLAAYLLVSGISEIIMAFQVRPVKGWGWELFSGIIAMLLGIMIWRQFPLSGIWAVGVLVGIRLFFGGLTLIMFGFAARSAVKA
jgi:uncharacterized membrane protein HdeD (DUF308 family)